MNHISCGNHPDSHLSGSTVYKMIDKAKELGNTYFAVTDHGHLASIIKSYKYAKEKEIKLIPGVELYFKDNDCDIIKGTEAEKSKYFKIVVHACDQNSYQDIVRLISDTSKPTVCISDHYYPLFNWKDLESISKLNITVSTANVEDIVSKNVALNLPDVAEKAFLKMLSIFGNKYYPAIIPFKHSMYWTSFIKITLGKESTETIQIPSSCLIETDKYKKTKAYELARSNFGGHKKIKKIYLNGMSFKLKPSFEELKKAVSINKFEDLSEDIQTKANKFILSMAKKHDCFKRLLINNYSYYADKEDKVVQDMKLGEEKRISQHQHMVSTEEIKGYITNQLGISEKHIAMLVKFTHNWAEKFKDFELKYDYKLLRPDGDLKKILVDRIKKVGRMRWEDKRYVSQLKEELDLLSNNGVIDLIPYFLPIVEIYDFYDKSGYLTGPARGSAGGFLISYLIGITHIDPIKYGLSSARFLTLDRVQQGNLPDIDSDLESRDPLVGRDGNSGYLFEKYGKKAAQISTRTLLRIKSAMLDANRFVNGGKVEDEITKLSKGLPTTPQGVNDSEYIFGYEDEHGNHVPGLIDNDMSLKEYAEKRPVEWNLVSRALSLSRQSSRHPCAFIISDRDVEDTVPIMEVGGVKRVTQPEHKDVEFTGLIKYDFLVVSALKDINLCLKYINNKNKDTDLKTGHFKHNGVDTYIWDLPEELDVFKMLWQGKTETVFQLNSTTATPLVKSIKPESILDCAVITSLGRPGPLDFKDERTGRNMAEEYAFRKVGQTKGDIEILNELIPETYGIIIFQEQVSSIAKNLGQMSVIDSENVRIAMGKKKVKLLNSLKPAFIEGASKKTDPQIAEKVWSMMETFSRYGFNLSHAVAYSVISYACAFLKYHYPLEWWAAVLSNADDKEINEVFYKYVKDMVLPPDINKSTEEMQVDYSLGKIRNKLSMLSGVGQKAAETIIKNRPYASIEDFVRKKACGQELTRKLIHVGVFDSLFKEGMSLEEKVLEHDAAIKKIEFEQKTESYEEKIKSAETEEEIAKIKKSLEKHLEKGPKEAPVRPEYTMISPKKDFLMKKATFPTMNLDLIKVLKLDSKIPIAESDSGDFLCPLGKRETRLLDGEFLQKIDSTDLKKDAYFVTPGYVIDTKEFSYSNNTRKALRVVIDSSGYISEKVLWPDYESGELNYPKELEKGAIVYFFYSKKAGKPYTNISDIIVEEKSIISKKK